MCSCRYTHFVDDQSSLRQKWNWKMVEIQSFGMKRRSIFQSDVISAELSHASQNFWFIFATAFVCHTFTINSDPMVPLSFWGEPKENICKSNLSFSIFIICNTIAECYLYSQLTDHIFSLSLTLSHKLRQQSSQDSKDKIFSIHQMGKWEQYFHFGWMARCAQPLHCYMSVHLYHCSSCLWCFIHWKCSSSTGLDSCETTRAIAIT